MRAVLVDDEPLARRELRRLLAPSTRIAIVGEAGHVDEAVERIDALDPDLIFLDVEMPGGSGFDVLSRIARVPRVIFTTAYDRFAVRAFDVNALDYLLKPIEPARLAAALSRLAPQIEERAADARPGGAGWLDRIFVKDGERCWFVPTAETRLFESDGNYTRLFWKDERPLLARSLTTLEARLDPRRFFRANRKHVINLDHVEVIEPWLAGRLRVTMTGGPSIEVSRRQARSFRDRSGV